MLIEEIQLYSFRNVEQKIFSFAPRSNYIIGPNGTGKTSILEALYFLAHIKSFRSNNNRNLLKEGSSTFNINARLQNYNKENITIKIQFTNASKTLVKINDQQCKSTSEVATILPLIFLDTNTHRSFASTPKIRRNFLNWCCFYSFKNHAEYLRCYNRILLQRNHFLKQSTSASKAQMSSWNEPFIYYADLIHKERLLILTQLKESLQHIWPELSPHFAKDITIDYSQGWPKDKCLKTCLENSINQDIAYGHTQYGPHRGDLRFKTSEGISIFEYFSQGQQKLFSYALKFSQMRILNNSEYAKSTPIILIDDLPAELDIKSRESILNFISNTNSQCFLTGLTEKDFSNTASSNIINLLQR